MEAAAAGLLMKKPTKPVEWMVWGGLGITLAIIIVLSVRNEVLKSRGPRLPVLFQIPSFTLTNQQGRLFHSEELRGKVWLADIVFTHCAGPCPRMTQRVAELQAAVSSDQPVRFVTLTTDPENDTPPILATYARRFGAVPERWHFLTGSKQQIAEVAIRGLKLTALPKEPEKMENPKDLFIHSTILIVIDKRGRARASIETEPAEGELAPDVKAVALPIIEQLLREN